MLTEALRTLVAVLALVLASNGLTAHKHQLDFDPPNSTFPAPFDNGSFDR